MAAPDGGWGWAVVVGTILVNFVNGGIERSFGVWYVDILKRYEAGAALTSWCIGIHETCRQTFCIFAAVLYAKLSSRALMMTGGLLLSTGIFFSAFAGNIFVFYLTFGLIGGLGSGMSTLAVVLAISEYFEKRKFLALGLTLCGSGFGSFFISALLTYLLLNVTYFESVIILSGIALQSLIGGAVCFPIYEPVDDLDEKQSLPEDKIPLIEKERTSMCFSMCSGDDKDLETSATPKFKVRKLVGERNFETDMLKNPLVIIYAIGAFVSIVGSFPIAQLIVDYAVEQGIEFKKASLIITITGLMEIVIRLSLGFLLDLDFVRSRAVMLWNMSFVGFGVSALLTAFSSEFWHFIPGMFINVVCYSLSRGFAFVMLSSVFEPTALVSVFAVYCFFIGIGIFCGTVFSGFLKDISGSYFISYLVMSFLCFFSSCFYFLNSFLMKKLRHDPKYRLLSS